MAVGCWPVAGKALGLKPKKLLLAKKQMTEELGVGRWSDFEIDIAKKSLRKKLIGKVQTRIIMMDVFFLSISILTIRFSSTLTFMMTVAFVVLCCCRS